MLRSGAVCGCQPESKQTQSLLLKINKPIRKKACYSSVGGIFARWKIINAFLFPRGEAEKVLSRIKSRKVGVKNYSLEKINNGTKLATSHVINLCSPQWREESTEGKIHHSSSPLAPRDACPSCVDESAYIF